jgi:hypothetical protein
MHERQKQPRRVRRGNNNIMRRILVCLALFLFVFAATASSDSRIPADPILMKETIVEVLGAGERCHCVDGLAIQPLLFALARHDQDSIRDGVVRVIDVSVG